MEYDAIMVSVYGSGRFQILLTVLCACTGFVWAFEIQSLVFIHTTPDFTCSDPQMDNFTDITWVSKSDYSRSIVKNSSRITEIEVVQQCWAKAFRHAKPEHFACAMWNFSQSPMQRTLVTDFSLVCDRAHLNTMLQTAILLTIAFGNVLTMFTDRVSRRKLLIFYCLWDISFMLIVPLVNTSLPLVYAVRILRMISSSIATLCLVIIQELLPTNERPLFANIYWLPFAFGYMITTGMAYLTRNWYTLRIYGLISLVAYVPIILLTTESPRWLLVYGKMEDFVGVIRRIATRNGVSLSESFYEELIVAGPKIEEEPAGEVKLTKQDTILDIFRYSNMRLKTLSMCFAQSATLMSYYGLITSADFSHDNIFLNVFYQGLAEIPSSLLAWKMSSNVGRRRSLLILLSLAGISVSVTAPTRILLPIGSTIVAIIGRIAIATNLCIGNLYATEIYPTTVRNMGVFLVVACSGIVGSLAPQVNALSDTASYLPGLIYGSLCFVGFLLVYRYLPETKYCAMAQTLSDSEKLIQENGKACL